MPNIVVLGSGMAGFGAAHRLHAEGITPVMYDKNNYHGGHTASFRSESGFLFDVGPHISFTKDSRIQDLFAESVDQQYETIQINLNNYWRGYWPKHPVQLHLHGLPEDMVVKVIADFVEERQPPNGPINNYADWLLASFGRTFAELFPMHVHAEVPPHDRREHEHGLAGTTHLPPQSRGSAARRALAFRSPCSLHHALSLSQRRRVHELSEQICAAGKPETQSRAGLHRSSRAAVQVLERSRRRTTMAWFLRCRCQTSFA